MKKIFLILISFVFTAGTNAQEKAFEKGNISVGVGAGIGFYKIKIHSEVTDGSSTVKKDTTDAAASGIFPLMVEYAITDFIGIGAKFAFSDYFEETDSVTGKKADTRSIDLDLQVGFHLVKSKRFDMPLILTVGYSNFKIKSNDIYNSQAKDNGINFGIELQPRIYFGDHVGMFFNLGYAGYSYPSLEFSDNINSYNNRDFKFSLKGSGVNIGLGLIGKF